MLKLNSLKVSSANCQGLQGKEKRQDVISFYKEKDYHIVCLQDTHLIEKDTENITHLWGGCCFTNGIKSNARGVAILIRNNFEYKVLDCQKDTDGNYLYLKLQLNTMSLNLINIYGPNSDTPSFFRHIQDILEQNSADYSIVCGDFNIILDPELDSFNYTQINNPKAREAVKNMLDSEDLIDIYRINFPSTKRFTWRKRKPLKQARLDYFLISSHMSNIINACGIKPGYRSDHSIIELEFILNDFKMGKGLWKFNNSLLKDKDYLTLVNKLIEEEIIKYAVPVYNISYLKNFHNYDQITLTIDWDTFLELFIMRVRGETIKFSTALKRKRNEKKEQLTRDIENLENLENLNNNFDLLEDKKFELEQIRKSELQGEIVRSRIQWLTEGEKPSRYFCNLTKKNFLEKTIMSVELEDGTQVSQQDDILKCIKTFYQKLFQNKDDKAESVNLYKIFENTPTKQVECKTLGKVILVEEISQALKGTKNNKTPGVDGITSEFLKVFWGRLKYIIQRAFNTSYEKGLMSQSLRTCIITCLPKGQKDRRFLKNWRPISLLSTFYKLMSGVIANRLKQTLNSIVSNTQTGFLSGRQISDSTRLVYDLMYHVEKKNIPGMLMLIDFEKAFDSLSWKFLYSVLAFFGYDQNFINWIKMFNNNIEAYALQYGKLSPKIIIERGCRQGDPISSYLFLLAAEILSLMIIQNEDIKGLKINGIEFKLTQFADDTTLILDGSQPSLQAALNILEIYGNYSGLNMNKEKTKVIWIGKKRLSKDKLKVSVKLDWGNEEFTLLGLDFSVDLKKMQDSNYLKVYDNINCEINRWKYKKLTPFGKISIIKSNILSKGIHVMTSLPTTEKFLHDVNSLLYSFLWDNKPDKVKRKTVCRDKSSGGLKMVNVYHFEKALKLSWIRRLLNETWPQWQSLLSITCTDLNNLKAFGCNYGLIINKKKIQNPFWQIIFEYWQLLGKGYPLKSNRDIIQSSIWYNPQITSEELLYPEWAKKGILFVGDLLHPNGELLDHNQIENKFNLDVNAFYYHRIKLLLKKFIKKNTDNNVFDVVQPFFPHHLSCLNANNACRTFYNILNNQNLEKNVPVCMTKWNYLLDEAENQQQWKIIFDVCFKSVADNSVIWLQYKILFNILSTRDYLYKINLKDNNLCVFCNMFPETITHLFCECEKVIQLWHNIEQWILMKIGVSFNFSNDVKILGYRKMDNNFWPVNFVILMTKKFIFKCAYKELSLNIYSLQNEVSKVFSEQKLISKINCKENFEKRWELWENLFV